MKHTIGNTNYGAAKHLGHNAYPHSTALYAVCGVGRLHNLVETDNVVLNVTCQNCKNTHAYKEARLEQLKEGPQGRRGEAAVRRPSDKYEAANKLIREARGDSVTTPAPALKLRSAVYELGVNFECGEPLLAYVDTDGDVWLGAPANDSYYDKSPISEDGQLLLTPTELESLIGTLQTLLSAARR